MTAFTNYLENELLDGTLGASTYTAPTTVYVKLHIGDPGENATSNAAAETTRVAATFGTPASGGTISNTANVDWTSVSNTETYSHISIWDNLTVGNPLYYGAMSATVAVTSGDDFRFPIGDIDVTLT